MLFTNVNLDCLGNIRVSNRCYKL